MMTKSMQVNDAGLRVKEFIEGFVASGENSLKNESNDPAWGKPLIGFSRGDDPIYTQMKEDIGSFFLTPPEIFAKTFPSITVRPDELTVISWILPQAETTKRDHRKETTLPSERWARARKYGEEFNAKLRKQLVEMLVEAGYEAVAPIDSPFWTQKMSERYGLSSTWSERHAAFASGLGTFGLCDGLITPVGKAMRCGSVVAHIQIPPSQRPYKDHHDYCLFFAKGICGKCADRCPAGAISREKGHDKEKCRAYVSGLTKEYVLSHFGFESYACGFCQVGVPCESGIPVKTKED
jgi:epoxyqueuosine reductase QueG